MRRQLEVGQAKGKKTSFGATALTRVKDTSEKYLGEVNQKPGRKRATLTIS